ncbi:Hypothetical predicted protein [Xyrichtys novacula]|uniref:Uncharacterized protein n=1 Tax=Xyrichtys novacula TaxID=13765 RepID=A0AAV1FL34_XYRNO|nr:Hypothetical predicted protein [Xyrichtys novacula]
MQPAHTHTLQATRNTLHTISQTFHSGPPQRSQESNKFTSSQVLEFTRGRTHTFIHYTRRHSPPQTPSSPPRCPRSATVSAKQGRTYFRVLKGHLAGKRGTWFV